MDLAEALLHKFWETVAELATLPHHPGERWYKDAHRSFASRRQRVHHQQGEIRRPRAPSSQPQNRCPDFTMTVHLFEFYRCT